MPPGAKWEEQFNVVVVSSFDLLSPPREGKGGDSKAGIVQNAVD